MQLPYLITLVLGLGYVFLASRYLLYQLRKVVNPLNLLMKIYLVVCVFGFTLPLIHLLGNRFGVVKIHENTTIEKELVLAGNYLLAAAVVFVFSVVLFWFTQLVVKTMYRINYQLSVIQNDFLFVSIHAILFVITSMMTSHLLLNLIKVYLTLNS